MSFLSQPDLPLQSDAVIGFSREVYEINLDDDNVIRIEVRMGDPELLFEVPVILDIAARSMCTLFDVQNIISLPNIAYRGINGNILKDYQKK